MTYHFPVEAFDARTMFLLHNGVDHYFAAYRRADVGGKPADPSAAPKGFNKMWLLETHVKLPAVLEETDAIATAARPDIGASGAASSKCNSPVLRVTRSRTAAAAEAPSTVHVNATAVKAAVAGLVQIGQQPSFAERRSGRDCKQSVMFNV